MRYAPLMDDMQHTKHHQLHFLCKKKKRKDFFSDIQMTRGEQEEK